MKSSIVLVFLIIIVAKCSRILIVFPMVAKSHYILGNALARALTEAGHDVTLISPFEEDNPQIKGKFKEVILTEMGDEKNLPKTMLNIMDLEKLNTFWNIPINSNFGIELTINMLEESNFQKFFNSNQHFDVVILEQFNNDALKALAYHYKAPLILFSTIGANSWVNPLVGNPSPPSYIPEFFFGYTSNMTFWERLTNLLFRILYILNRQLIFFPTQNKIMHKYFPYFPDAPDLEQLVYNASLILLNSHESVNQAIPHVPNMVSIGGFHINEAKELPKDLKQFMDKATEGVIYFSMGSNIRPQQISDDQKQVILRVFGKIKQKVLWKWDEDILEGKPENVKLAKWFPQADILAHPNTKLFITHGGLLSTIETIYYGVPILVFPIFADQKLNAARAVMDGYGLSLKFSELNEENLSEALNKILNNTKYRENAKKHSILMKDRPIKPLDLAVYWIEYVIRHRGAPHLRVAGLNLPWYQYLLLDVISFVVLCFVVLLSLVYLIFKTTCCRNIKNENRKLKKN